MDEADARAIARVKIPFSIGGRIGRTRYLLYLMAYFLSLQLSNVLSVLLSGGVPLLRLFVLVFAFLSYCCVTVKRTHDIGLSGWFALVLGLPGINLLLLAIPGNNKINRFGDPPLSPSPKEKWVTGGATAATISVLVLIYVWIVEPAVAAYQTRVVIIPVPWVRVDDDILIERIDFTTARSLRMKIEGYETADATYDAVGRSLYVTIALDGTLYDLEFRYDPDSGLLKYIEEDKVLGVLSAQ